MSTSEPPQLDPRDRSALRLVVAADRTLFLWVTAWRPKRLTEMMKWITGLGDTRAWLVVGAISFASGPAGKQLAGIMVLGGLLSIISTNILKLAVQRRRPFESGLDRRLIHEPFGNSFPSGHSTQALTIMTAVGVLYPPVALPLAVLGLAIAGSRVYLGVHFPLDVGLGVFLGVFLGHLAVWLHGLISL
jgi:membrane-associated phospholipid phosphatase